MSKPYSNWEIFWTRHAGNTDTADQMQNANDEYEAKQQDITNQGYEDTSTKVASSYLDSLYGTGTYDKVTSGDYSGYTNTQLQNILSTLNDSDFSTNIGAYLENLGPTGLAKIISGAGSGEDYLTEVSKLTSNYQGYLSDVKDALDYSLGSSSDWFDDLENSINDTVSSGDEDVLSAFASTAGKTSGGSFGQSGFASLLEQNRGDALTDTSQFSSVVPAEDYSKLLDNTANKSYNNKKTGGSLNASTLKAFGG